MGEPRNEIPSGVWNSEMSRNGKGKKHHSVFLPSLSRFTAKFVPNSEFRLSFFRFFCPQSKSTRKVDIVVFAAIVGSDVFEQVETG